MNDFLLFIQDLYPYHYTKIDVMRALPIRIQNHEKAFFDRCIWIQLDHQSLDYAIKIVNLRTSASHETIIKAAQIAEVSRSHQDLVRGGSVRAAIQMASMIHSRQESNFEDWTQVALAVLGNKVEMAPHTMRNKTDIIEEIVKLVFAKEKPPTDLSSKKDCYYELI